MKIILKHGGSYVDYTKYTHSKTFEPIYLLLIIDHYIIYPKFLSNQWKNCEDGK